jgi:DNA-binding response OmpR family regulator
MVVAFVSQGSFNGDACRQKTAIPQLPVDHASSKRAPAVFDTAREGWKRSNPGAVFVFDDVAINFAGMEARRNGNPVALRLKEFKTLTYLIQNSGRVISRDELLNEVWGYECYPCTRTVDNHILQLRRKLEAEPSRPKHFLTVHGTGYKFLP